MTRSICACSYVARAVVTSRNVLRADPEAPSLSASSSAAFAAFCVCSSTVFAAVTRLRYACVTSVVICSVRARTSYAALSRFTRACSTFCSRAKPLKIGSEIDAFRLNGALSNLNGWFCERAAANCASLSVGDPHPSLARPAPARSESNDEQFAYPCAALSCALRSENFRVGVTERVGAPSGAEAHGREVAGLRDLHVHLARVFARLLGREIRIDALRHVEELIELERRLGDRERRGQVRVDVRRDAERLVRVEASRPARCCAP